MDYISMSNNTTRRNLKVYLYQCINTLVYLGIFRYLDSEMLTLFLE